MIVIISLWAKESRLVGKKDVIGDMMLGPSMSDMYVAGSRKRRKNVPGRGSSWSRDMEVENCVVHPNICK